MLIFSTGADKIPPLGFDQEPKLTFLESAVDNMLPTASTCAIELRLPTCHSQFHSFKEYMTMALKSYGGFGGI